MAPHHLLPTDEHGSKLELPVIWDASDADAQSVLRSGEIEVLGRMPYSSNATFLIRIDHRETPTAAIYKPERGERPLWDFPSGLYRREIAAFELSRALGWNIIPATIEREGPFGVGSVQLFIDAHFEQHYFTLAKKDEHHADLQRICAFDFLANNTDRKSGHCLASRWGPIYGIDQGLCFAEDFKLRTVIWDFAGQPFGEELAAAVTAAASPPAELAEWLRPEEMDALAQRAEWLSEFGQFPSDDGSRHWPWPLV
ncbi:SCO1664 family protein [Candidatus Poriferisodalis sp.]|uniref:SCO1664 family protein n=1 Tax=Candidatus Poriferisodalis sp. TaxID=3101277 RepID=UPI003B027CA2